MSIVSGSELTTGKMKNSPTLTGRSRLGTLTGIEIAATGSYVPETIVANEDLAALGCDSDWIVQRTGILERRRALPHQATSDLALAAARQCLQRANVDAKDVDLLVVATITPDHSTPSTACHLQRQLGCIAPAMDVNAACAGFMYALVTAGHFVASQTARNALVIGAEVMSRTINPQDVKTYPLFGDGAGAVLLRPSANDRQGLISYTLGAEGCGGQMLCVPCGGSRMPLTAEAVSQGQHYLQMEGRSVFKWAVRVVADSTRDCLNHSGTNVDDLDLFILHQANIRIIDSAVADFAVPREKVFVNLDRYGNTSAASIPLALDEAISTGQLKSGNRALMCGFGSGLAWGTAIIQL
ncbi:MAG: ketoacyl-ACP synthase III [Planctomycetales bacterium]|nr:ketoacyl-ACP synthase III [Planctomycetales bacterium]